MRKSLLSLIILGGLVFFIMACQASGNQENLEKADVQELPTAKDGIEIKIQKEIYPPNTDEITIVVKNNSKNELNATSFHLEKNIDGEWFKFPVKEKESIDAIGGYQPPGSTSNIVLNTDELKYELSSGLYRATFIGLGTEFNVED